MAHPDEHSLVAWLERRLDDRALVDVESHVAACGQCWAVVDALRSGEVATVALATEISAPSTRDVPTPERSSGEMVGHFRLIGAIGHGGMGTVYLARDTKLDRFVALKMIHRERTHSPELREMFMLEARATAKFSHPNIVTIHAVDEHLGQPYLVLEYLEGHNLRRRQREAPVSLAETLRIGAGIATALHEAHRRDILHLDLKPENVFLPTEGPLRVLDFGLAETLGATSGEEGEGFPPGTPPYMAPERWRNLPSFGATDVWALGVILFELCAERRPFVGSDLPALAISICNPEPAPPLAESLPRGLRELVARCLEKDPLQRPSAGDCVGVLEGLLTERQRSAATRVPTLAVLPLRVGGEGVDAGFSHALTDELIDVLSRIRGWRVLGAAATARYRDWWEPKMVAEELGVDAIVHGTIQVSGGRVRVVARLVDAASGSQSWSGRFDGTTADLFELQENMSKRIAEALRTELSTTIYRGAAGADAIELYLRGRQQASVEHLGGADGAVALFERCLAAAPDFKPALSAFAISCVRAWFSPFTIGERDWAQVSQLAVARALRDAPELPESHIAGARHSVTIGDYAAAARHLAHALEIAPTCAPAHHYLAMLQCEAGRGAEGVRRARLAIDLDPSLYLSLYDLARHHALDQDWERCDAALRELAARVPADHPPLLLLGMRLAVWRSDLDELRRTLESFRGAPPKTHEIIRLPARVILQEITLSDGLATFTALTGAEASPRFLAMSAQIYAETAFAIGDQERGVALVLGAAKGPLVDIDWMDRCPLLAPMRQRPEFAAARRTVLERCAAIWRSGCPPLDLS